MSVKVCFHWMFEEPDYYQWFVAKVHFQWFVVRVHFHWMFEEPEYYHLLVAKVCFHYFEQLDKVHLQHWTVYLHKDTCKCHYRQCLCFVC